jgi:thiol-disulfide isomerase/thioredoxin
VTGPVLVSYIVLWVLMLALAVSVFALYHHFGQLYLNSREGRDQQGPANDKPLRRTTMRDVFGRSLGLPGVGLPNLIVFMSTSCPLCNELRPDLERFASVHDEVDTIIVCGGERDSVEEWAGTLNNLARVIPDPGQRIAARYRIGVLPFYVGVDEEGIVQAKGIVNEGGLDLALALTLGAGRYSARDDGEVDHDRLIEMGHSSDQSAEVP